MSPAESLELLMLASYYDPTLLPAHDDDREIKARLWAEAIDPTVTVEQAQTRIISHYAGASARKPLTPADINAAWQDQDVYTTGAAKAIGQATGIACPPDVDLRPGSPYTPQVFATACPWCKAPAYEVCTIQFDGRVVERSTPHPSRTEAAAA